MDSKDASRAAARPQSGLGGSPRYDAFLSYSHHDRLLAAGVQRALHRIGRRAGRLTALRVFRDDTDLAANPDLWGHVTEALERSRYFVLVLSPSAATSPWVNREVAHWLETRGSAELLVVVGSGELVWDSSLGGFDPVLSTSAPPALLEPGVLAQEPLYVDVSGEEPWDASAPVFRDRMTALAAPMHGKSRYELASEDVAEQRRYRRWRLAAIVGLVLLLVTSLVAGSFAALQWREADAQREEAITQRNQAVSLGLAAASANLLGTNDSLAVALAAESVLATPDPPVEAVRALIEARVTASRHAGLPAGAPKRLNRPDCSDEWACDPVAVAFSADSATLASVSRDGTLQRWDTADGHEISRQSAGIVSIESAAFTADLGVAVIAGEGRVTVWDSVAGRVLRVLQVGTWRGTVAVNGQGTRLAAETVDGVALWDIASGQLLQRLPKGAAGFSPAGDLLAIGGADRLSIIDVLTGSVLRTFPLLGDEDPPSSVAFSPDASVLATGHSADVRLWDVRTGRQTVSPMGEGLACSDGCLITSITFSRDGESLTAVGGRGLLPFFATDTGSENGRLTIHRGELTGAAAFSPDGRHFAAAVWSDALLWGTTVGQEAGTTLTSDGPERPTSIDGGGFLPGGRLVAWAGGGHVVVWDLTMAKEMSRFLPDHGCAPSGFACGAQSLAVSEKLDMLVTGGADGSVRIWDPSTGEPAEPQLAGHKAEVTDLAISPSGVLASAGLDGVRVWSTADGSLIRELPEPSVAIAFSLDGSQLAVGGSSGHVTLWDVQSPSPAQQPELTVDVCGGDDCSPTWIRFSPDGERLAVGRHENLSLFDLPSRQEIGSYSGAARAEFSADGAVLVTDGGEWLEIVDPASGETVTSLSARDIGPVAQFGRGEVNVMSFSPDGAFLMAAGNEGTYESGDIRLLRPLWDPQQGCALTRPYVSRAELDPYLPTGWQTGCDYDAYSRRALG